MIVKDETDRYQRIDEGKRMGPHRKTMDVDYGR
jgi:hypothetical protein